jgi:cation:H+ antiporter
MDSILNSFLNGLEANSPNLYLVALAGCILVGIFLLTKGGDILTDGASDLARTLGVHPAIIGLTVVSIATSAPELFTSLAAIAGDAKDLIIGNVVGSNLANIGLVLGIATFINPIAMKGSLANWQTNLLLLTTLLFSISCLWIGKESFDRPLGIVFSIILVAYLIVVTRGAIIDRKAAKNSSDTVPESKGDEDLAPPWKSLLIVLVASGALWLGSEVLVTGAKGLAKFASIPQEIIGLTIVAIGTSLPELAASCVLAKRGESGMLLGNIVGSNLFNLTFVAGIAGIVSPIPVNPSLVQVEFPVMLLLTGILCWLMRKKEIRILHGTFLLIIYFATLGAAWFLHG